MIPEAAYAEPLPWMSDAVCTTTDPELFFPQKGGTAQPARKICDSCPVKALCLEYGLHETEGIYAGMTPRMRKRYRNENGIRQRKLPYRMNGAA